MSDVEAKKELIADTMREIRMWKPFGKMPYMKALELLMDDYKELLELEEADE